jgi:hypothetical protein
MFGAITNLFGSGKKSPRSNGRGRSEFRPTLEALEERRLLSGGIVHLLPRPQVIYGMCVHHACNHGMGIIGNDQGRDLSSVASVHGKQIHGLFDATTAPISQKVTQNFVLIGALSENNVADPAGAAFNSGSDGKPGSVQADSRPLGNGSQLIAAPWGTQPSQLDPQVLAGIDAVFADPAGILDAEALAIWTMHKRGRH